MCGQISVTAARKSGIHSSRDLQLTSTEPSLSTSTTATLKRHQIEGCTPWGLNFYFDAITAILDPVSDSANEQTKAMHAVPK